MLWNGFGGMGFGGFGLGFIVAVLFWVLLIFGTVYLSRFFSDRKHKKDSGRRR